MTNNCLDVPENITSLRTFLAESRASASSAKKTQADPNLSSAFDNFGKMLLQSAPICTSALMPKRIESLSSVVGALERILWTEPSLRGCRLLPFGSSANGLGRNTSDLDLCIWRPSDTLVPTSPSPGTSGWTLTTFAQASGVSWAGWVPPAKSSTTELGVVCVPNAADVRAALKRGATFQVPEPPAVDKSTPADASANEPSANAAADTSASAVDSPPSLAIRALKEAYDREFAAKGSAENSEAAPSAIGSLADAFTAASPTLPTAAVSATAAELPCDMAGAVLPSGFPAVCATGTCDHWGIFEATVALVGGPAVAESLADAGSSDGANKNAEEVATPSTVGSATLAPSAAWAAMAACSDHGNSSSGKPSPSVGSGSAWNMLCRVRDTGKMMMHLHVIAPAASAKELDAASGRKAIAAAQWLPTNKQDDTDTSAEAPHSTKFIPGVTGVVGGSSPNLLEKALRSTVTDVCRKKLPVEVLSQLVVAINLSPISCRVFALAARPSPETAAAAEAAVKLAGPLPTISCPSPEVALPRPLGTVRRQMRPDALELLAEFAPGGKYEKEDKVVADEPKTQPAAGAAADADDASGDKGGVKVVSHSVFGAGGPPVIPQHPPLTKADWELLGRWRESHRKIKAFRESSDKLSAWTDKVTKALTKVYLAELDAVAVTILRHIPPVAGLAACGIPVVPASLAIRACSDASNAVPAIQAAVGTKKGLDDAASPKAVSTAASEAPTADVTTPDAAVSAAEASAGGECDEEPGMAEEDDDAKTAAANAVFHRPCAPFHGAHSSEKEVLAVVHRVLRNFGVRSKAVLHARTPILKREFAGEVRCTLSASPPEVGSNRSDDGSFNSTTMTSFLAAQEHPSVVVVPVDDTTGAKKWTYSVSLAPLFVPLLPLLLPTVHPLLRPSPIELEGLRLVAASVPPSVIPPVLRGALQAAGVFRILPQDAPVHLSPPSLPPTDTAQQCPSASPSAAVRVVAAGDNAATADSGAAAASSEASASGSAATADATSDDASAAAKSGGDEHCNAAGNSAKTTAAAAAVATAAVAPRLPWPGRYGLGALGDALTRVDVPDAPVRVHHPTRQSTGGNTVEANSANAAMRAAKVALQLPHRWSCLQFDISMRHTGLQKARWVRQIVAAWPALFVVNAYVADWAAGVGIKNASSGLFSSHCLLIMTLEALVATGIIPPAAVAIPSASPSASSVPAALTQALAPPAAGGADSGASTSAVSSDDVVAPFLAAVSAAVASPPGAPPMYPWVATDGSRIGGGALWRSGVYDKEHTVHEDDAGAALEEFFQRPDAAAEVARGVLAVFTFWAAVDTTRFCAAPFRTDRIPFSTMEDGTSKRTMGPVAEIRESWRPSNVALASLPTATAGVLRDDNWRLDPLVLQDLFDSSLGAGGKKKQKGPSKDQSAGRVGKMTVEGEATGTQNGGLLVVLDPFEPHRNLASNIAREPRRLLAALRMFREHCVTLGRGLHEWRPPPSEPIASPAPEKDGRGPLEGGGRGGHGHPAPREGGGRGGRGHPAPLEGGGRGGRGHPAPLEGGGRGGRGHPAPLEGGGRGGHGHPAPREGGGRGGRGHPAPLEGGGRGGHGHPAPREGGGRGGRGHPAPLEAGHTNTAGRDGQPASIFRQVGKHDAAVAASVAATHRIPVELAAAMPHVQLPTQSDVAQHSMRHGGRQSGRHHPHRDR
eukprot:TRINITY_DN1068_c0_g1_i1.p1 TRINITY_DN1068_c0_g1~~TRINITY_DN1068_c0_g1_i1.p1  ORF type:complete len:1804 (+),score=195.98 TRINITY_DN1068_c0_g1_i1:353-5413(+)